MCGFSGMVSLKRIGETSMRSLERMVLDLKRRGADQTGKWVNTSGNVCFIHTRLAIQDLRADARQPFSFDRLTLVFNGEVYNFRSIRRDLAHFGYTFSSDCDTEVILKAYHYWCSAALHRFNGEFALAIWDEVREELFIARDRFGIKPLYYSMIDDKFSFCSDMPSLARNIADRTRLDVKAIHAYFSMQGIIPYPHTPFESIRKLGPSRMATISLRMNGRGMQFSEQQYYNLSSMLADSRGSILSEMETTEATREALISAVKHRLLADVDIGVWLSGGLDSSLLTAIACAELGYRPRTFSVGFDSTTHEIGNEFEFSRIVANKYSAEHHEYLYSTADIMRHMRECLTAANEPMMSNDYIGHYLLGRQTAEAGMKVAMCGLGADEVWYGYDWHDYLARNPYSDKMKAFLDTFVERTPFELSQVLTPKYGGMDHTAGFLHKYMLQFPGSPFLAVVLADLDLIMVDDPVKRADSAGMSHAVEVRAPFLDHHMVEFGLSIPLDMGQVKRTGKYILKKIAEKYFPRDFIYRKKGYFAVPQVKHTIGFVQEFCRCVLEDERCRSRGLYQVDAIAQILETPQQLSAIGGNLLWQLTCFEAWMQQFD